MERIDLLLRTLVTTEGATDLHLKVGSPPRMRVKGVLDPVPGQPELDKATVEAMATAILPGPAAEAFAARHEAACAYALDGVGRFRVAAYRQRGSATLILRRVETLAGSLGELGLPSRLRQLAEAERGLLLVSGPARSGRTRTLAALVDHLNHSRACHIVTVEDPVEVLHRDRMAAISQREVGRDVPSTAAGVAAALRHDPDVIVIDHLDGPAATEVALSAAESGCLVVAGVLAGDVGEALRRLVSAFPPEARQQMRLALVGALVGATCQRLVPTASGEERVPAVEVLVSTPATRLALVGNDDAAVHDEMEAGAAHGMQTLNQALVALLSSRAIDLRTAMAATADWHELRALLSEDADGHTVAAGVVAVPTRVDGGVRTHVPTPLHAHVDGDERDAPAAEDDGDEDAPAGDAARAVHAGHADARHGEAASHAYGSLPDWLRRRVSSGD
jgi:twitching motility protein PilT